MSDFSPLTLTVEKTIPKRKEVIVRVIGNAFVSIPPFQNLPVILDKSADAIVFESVSVLPSKWFKTTGKLALIEEGVQTRAVMSLKLTGLLLLTYFILWVPAIGLWMVQGLWARWINPDLVALIQDWVLFLLFISPALMFLGLRRRIRLRMEAYVNNLVFYT